MHLIMQEVRNQLLVMCVNLESSRSGLGANMELQVRVAAIVGRVETTQRSNNVAAGVAR